MMFKSPTVGGGVPPTEPLGESSQDFKANSAGCVAGQHAVGALDGGNDWVVCLTMRYTSHVAM